MIRSYRVLTGPTAAGKTDWLEQHAADHPVLAVSADSRQVFRHMDIGTGKPTAAQTEVLPHRVINVSDPADKFSVYSYLPQAVTALTEAAERGYHPWIIGGTGLYIKSLVEGLPLGPPPRSKLRESLEEMLKLVSARELSSQLGLELAEPDNPLRLIRAAEKVCNEPEQGQKLYAGLGLTVDDYSCDSTPVEDSEYTRALDELRSWRCTGIAVLDPGHEQLAENISSRVSSMFEQGLPAEVRHLRELGFGEAKVVREGIGYREAARLVDGEIQQDEAINSTIIRTRQYAKRQRTYFRGQGWASMDKDGIEAWAAAGRQINLDGQIQTGI